MSARDILSSIYGGGANKTASANEDIDLTQISAAQLLELLAAEEKDEEKVASAMLEKMANDGTLAQYDMVGRVIARAFADETAKLASGEELPDDIEVDLTQVSAAQLQELMEAGYEFADGTEKTAGRMDAVKAKLGIDGVKNFSLAELRSMLGRGGSNRARATVGLGVAGGAAAGASTAVNARRMRKKKD